jgi:hypothetical protein
MNQRVPEMKEYPHEHNQHPHAAIEARKRNALQKHLPKERKDNLENLSGFDRSQCYWVVAYQLRGVIKADAA